MSHTLEFSIMEINKTALNKSRIYKLARKTKRGLARVWVRKEIRDDESVFLLCLVAKTSKDRK